MTHREIIIRGFFEKKIIQISTDPLFQLTSGKTAPVYIDHRKIFSFSELRKNVISEWAFELKKHFPLSSMHEKLVFAGTATAGIAPAYALAEHFQCGFVYVRNKPKEHGLKSAIEGVIPEGAQVVVIDDMVTTGSSILSAVQILKEQHIPILGASSISRHDLDKTNACFSQSNVNLVSLFKTNDVFLVACELGLISHKEFDVIQNWFSGL